MYVIELAFGDDPRRLEARPGHRERLAQLYAEWRLVISGPWDDDSGALLVLDTDRDGVDEIMAADEYYRAPGVTIVSIRQWNPLFGPRSA